VSPAPVSGPSRDWAVAVFVVWRGRVLLHEHAALGRWLPCGGHVEPLETPDDAALREVLEESGVAITLLGEPPISAPGPRQLARPRGVQLESIGPGHEHIDLVYLARPEAGYDGALRGPPSLGWYDWPSLGRLPLTPEIRAWCALALAEVGPAD
jgi:8-oxo-dGTP pyrophosphatase MutT (NUDIX family)